jgi:hypothetical protein
MALRSTLTAFAGTVLTALFLPHAAYSETKRPPVLSCDPAVLTDSSTLKLRFALPHPTELAIVAPDGTFYFVVYDRNPDTPAGHTPLVGKAAFRGMAELNLEVSKATATPLEYGRNTNERIFRTPGKYKVVLANNIQSDDDRDVYRCQVTLKSAK